MKRAASTSALDGHLREKRRHIYNDVPAVGIDMRISPTTETCRQANQLFDIEMTPRLKGYKLAEKRESFHHLIHAAKRALHCSGCVLTPRNAFHPAFSKARLQVIDAAVDAGLFEECRSPKGSPKMSRILPMPPIALITEVDPWEFEPKHSKKFVRMRNRSDKDEIAFDVDHPVAVQSQNRLERVNDVNALFEISYLTYDRWAERFADRKRLRPVHYAIFTNDFAHHGRLYTGRYGHQSLRKFERQTIRFEDFNRGELCVEPDYRGDALPNALASGRDRVPR